MLQESTMYLLESELTMRDHSKVSNEYQAALDWIKNELDINISPTRLGEYSRYLSKKSKIDSIEDYKKYYQTIYELDDILKIYNAFATVGKIEVINKFKNAFSGQVYRYNSAQSETDQSRNFLHELVTAARFIKAGFDTDITQICDIVVRFDNKTLFVECKRVKNKQQLLKIINEARTQLKNRIDYKGSNKHGYITLDITDLLMQIDNQIKYKNIELLKLHAEIKVNEIKDEFRQKIISATDKYVTGVMLCSNHVGVIQKDSNKDVIMCLSSIHLINCGNSNTDIKLHEFISRKIC